MIMKKIILVITFLALFSLPVALRAQVQLSIDFETSNTIPDEFTNDSSYPWIIENTENGHCMRSGNSRIASSSSSIELSYTFTEAGYIIFDANCCGEGASTVWDKCIFYIDNVMQFEYGEQISGWQNYVFYLEAGAHTFMWKYIKDSSVNPSGDAFFVDNIVIGYGTPCIQPYNITVNFTTNSAIVNWSGSSDSYTIHYKPLNASEWDTIPNISGNSDTLYNLVAGDYEIMVFADCNDEGGVLDTITVFPINSINWYGYAAYSLDIQSWNEEYIRFTMLDPATITAATSSFPSTYAAAYAYGHVWFISSGNLYIAPLNDSIGTIGDIIPVAFDFETTNTPLSMSFNPMDNKLYYIAISEGDESYYLKYFNPLQPDSVSTLELSIAAYTLAINALGEAYCIEYETGNLYQLDLTNASATLIGNTGHSPHFVQDMAFDMETNELFWANISSSSDVGLYHVNTENAATAFLGQIGGGSGAEITGLFCSNVLSNSVIPNSLNLSGDTMVCSGNTTTLTASSDVDGLFVWSTGHIGQWETFSPGTYSVSVFSITGNSLTKTINITEGQVYDVTDSLTICENQLPYIWNEVEFETAGTQNVTLTTINGCDSVVKMTLTVNNLTTGDTIVVACNSFDWYEHVGIMQSCENLTHTFTNAAGCDSVVTLHLTVNYSNTGDTTAVACDSFDWYEHTGITQSCENLTHTFTNAMGCDSVVTLHLTVNYSNTGDTTAVACDSFDWYEHTGITQSCENLTHTFTNATGCDSVVTLHLTVNYSNTGDTTVVACDSYNWYEHVGINQSCENLTHTFTNAAGCDSVVTLHLTVNYSNTGDTTAVACDSFDWYEHTDITQSCENLTHTFINAGGCDSVVTLHLTVNYSNTGDTTVVACESFDWYEHTGITQSCENLTHTFTNAMGCDSVVTLHLTINNPLHTAVIENTCESYTWNGTTYTVSGNYTYSHIDVNGCTQVDTLHLTINNPVHTAITENACESYMWNETLYTDGGDYTYSHVDENGCTQVDTLHLTIFNDAISEFTIVTEEPCYTWNNVEYCETGDYSQTFQTIHSCDSLVTLHLTITVGLNDYETVDFKVYPNPTSNIVNVECIMKNEELGDVEIQVVDAYGRLVDLEETLVITSLQNVRIDLSHNASGIYFVKAVADGKTIAVRKVVKQ